MGWDRVEMVAVGRLLGTILVTVLGASFQFYSFAVLNTPQAIVEGWINGPPFPLTPGIWMRI